MSISFTRSLAPCAALLLLLNAGCERASEDQTTPAEQTLPAEPAPGSTDNGDSAPDAAPADSRADVVTIAGLMWAIPENWESVGASGMRAAEYRISSDAGEASARFFTIQGSAQMNIDRWKGQVKDPTDGPTTDIIETPDGLRVHTVAVSGAYAGMGPGGASTVPQPGTRFLGAFIEGGPQPVQVVLTGPESLVRAIESQWTHMLTNLRK